MFRWIASAAPESRSDQAIVVATLAVIVGVLAAAVVIVEEPSEDIAFVDAPTLVSAAPSTTTTSTTTVAAAAAPPAQRPAPPPPPRAVEPIVLIGKIHIPKIGLVHPVYEGVTLRVIDEGPGHWPGSAVPGQLGNAVFAGHRVTHSHPFRNLDQLVPGDEIIFEMNNGVFTYRMTGTEVVTPKDVHIVNPTADATVTLFACHPPGSARQRIVVRGGFVSARPA